MPGTVKVRVISARNLPVMDRATFLTDAFVELCIGSITYKTEVVRRSLNPSWNSEWFCFELDDRALQDEALLLKVMDHDTYSAHDTIGRVYFDLNPLLSRGQTRCLNGWFPIYDTMHGIRGEICLAIRVDVFLDASRYHQSSLGVRFYHCCTIPQGFVIDSLIGFIQELVMNDDPEHQWIEKIRTSRASNEARQRLFSRLSGELQRKMGLKVLNIGGNSLIGYQLHFDLEGETGVVVRGIGTAVRLKKYSPVTTPPNTPTGISKNSSYNWESPNASYKESGVHNFQSHIPQALELGEFPFLTISQPLPGMILHFGSLIASKSVRLLDKNSPAGIQFRDAWWLELRTEIVAHMRSIGCDAVLAYREECTIYEDVCILQSYGTAVQINPKWINNLSYKITNTNSLGRISVTLAKASKKICESISTSNYFATIDRCTSKKPCTRSCSPDFTSARHSLHISSSETTPVPSPTSSYNKESYKEETTPDKCLPHKKIFHDINNSVKPNCHICHLPSTSDTNPNRFTSPVTSSRCAICKAANVPDLLFSSSDFPPELVIIGNPALVQARVCRSKKDTKGEVAASELSEILPFIDYELHYRLMQKLRLRNMNGLFGLRYRIAVGEYMIAAIATGTGVYIGALPSPPPPRIIPSLQVSSSAIPEDRCGYERLRRRIDDYLKKSRQLYRIPDMDYQSNLTKHDKFEIDTMNDKYYTIDNCTNHLQFIENEFSQLDINSNATINNLKQSTLSTSDLIHSHNTDDTLFLETREPEIEELAVLLQDPFQPQGLILTTTESIPISNDNSIINDNDNSTLNNSKVFIHSSIPVSMNSNEVFNWNYQSNSFIRVHETELTVPDSFFETSIYSTNYNTTPVFTPTYYKESNHLLNTTIVTSLSATTTVTSSMKSHISTQNYQNLTHSNSGILLNFPQTPTTRNNNINNSSSNYYYDYYYSTNSEQMTTTTLTSSTSTFISSPSSSPSSNSLSIHNNNNYYNQSIVKTKQHNTLHCINGNSLGKALREFNQLTWFRFRHYIPCIINALDYRLSFTDDEHIQIIATGMILHPTNSSITRNDEKQHTMFNAQSNDSSSSTSNNNNHNSNSVGNFDVDDDDNANGRKASIKNRSKFHLHKPTLLSRLKSDLKSRSLGKRTTDGMMINNDDIPTEQKQCKQQFIDKQHISGCILTPLSSIPNTYVEAYLGNLDFFFVRETTDLREVGGISGFLHTSLAEVQAVVGAHTTSLGGNALLSYHLSEVVVLRPTSRNQAQCLLNVCGDMARISWEITK
uniref:C2 domain-containing protein n=1 Tax=Schistosoma mansoni TaxID=6183 RepID=A0A5K4ENE1_SCHMA